MKLGYTVKTHFTCRQTLIFFIYGIIQNLNFGPRYRSLAPSYSIFMYRSQSHINYFYFLFLESFIILTSKSQITSNKVEIQIIIFLLRSEILKSLKRV